MFYLDLVEDFICLPVDVLRDTVQTVRGVGPMSTGKSSVINRLHKISDNLEKILNQN